MTIHPRPLTLLTGDIGLIIIFLQNQLVSYANRSSSHDWSGLKCLDTREKSPKEKISESAEKRKSWSSPCKPILLGIFQMLGSTHILWLCAWESFLRHISQSPKGLQNARWTTRDLKIQLSQEIDFLSLKWRPGPIATKP